MSSQIFWSGSGTLVVISAEDTFHLLRFDRDAYAAAVDAGADLGDEGVEEAFEMIAEIPEVYVLPFFPFRASLTALFRIKTAKWIGDCFIYTNAANRLNYLVGQQSHTITQFDR